MKVDQDEIAKMDDQDLAREVLTVDGKGKEYKKIVFVELLRRAHSKGWDNAIDFYNDIP